ncbi:hypothetical protein [Maribacter sp. ACAM166]|nr:hypothetical protein [Maribacter sp. ACAM166]
MYFLVVSEDALKKHYLTPRARIITSAVVRVELKRGIGPMYA